jgi:hypothetical protein
VRHDHREQQAWRNLLHNKNDDSSLQSGYDMGDKREDRAYCAA